MQQTGRCRFDNSLISYRKAPVSSQKRVSNTKVAKSKEISLEVKQMSLKPFAKFNGNYVECLIPITTCSEANGGKKIKGKGEHWSEKSRRHTLQKQAVFLILRPLKSHYSLKTSKITLTRYAPGKLDRFDNLPMSLKWVLDAVCELITGDSRPGRADASPLILDVKYDQVTNPKYFVGIKIEC